MAWTPQRAYFAVIAVIGPPAARQARAAAGFPPLVILTGDDFADVLARRQVLLGMRPGCPLQVVWGHDGAPVTVEQMHRLSGTAPATTNEAGEAVAPTGPIHPRLLRPDAWPSPRPERPRLEPLEDPRPATCSACAARRNHSVAELTPLCDPQGRHAPTQPDLTESSHL